MEAVFNLMNFGFSENNCKIALKKCDMNSERAADFLFNHMGEELEDDVIPASSSKWQPHPGKGLFNLTGLITHLGTSVTSGHYVAHLKFDNDWVLYNDHKVAKSIDAPIDKAYMYFWTKAKD